MKSTDREKRIIAQAVTETKQTKSSKQDNSTESKSDLIQVKMATLFDMKLEHLLDTYLYVKNSKYGIWQTFFDNDILNYNELFDTHTLESLKKLKQKKGNSNIIRFIDGKLRLVNNALLYYKFLRQDDEVTTANNPTLWDKNDFRDWKSDGFPVSTKALNASRTGNTTTTHMTLNSTNTATP